jgi:hypothetical protein
MSPRKPSSKKMLHKCIAAALAALVVAGCGSGLPKTIRVSGRVTFDGQPPPGPGKIYFLPTEPAPGFPSRPAKGDYDADGRYRATTFEPGDGLMPGKYLISIESWDAPPNMTGNPGKSHIPEKYQSPQTSGFKIDITPKMGPQEMNVDVVTKGSA